MEEKIYYFTEELGKYPINYQQYRYFALETDEVELLDE